jgi:hypothetical protein
MLNNKAAIAVRNEDQVAILLLPNPSVSQARMFCQGTSCPYLFGRSNFRADSMQHITA